MSLDTLFGKEKFTGKKKLVNLPVRLGQVKLGLGQVCKANLHGKNLLSLHL